MSKLAILRLLHSIRHLLSARNLQIAVVLFTMAISLQARSDITASGLQIPQSIPEARTLWEFMDEYTGDDKIIRLFNSFAVGEIGGCSGTMISPHIFMTAAHCGGPDHSTRTVTFFRINEDTVPSPSNQTTGGFFRARPLPWQSFMDPSGLQIGDIMLWWLEDWIDGVPPGIKYGYLELSPESVSVGDQAYSFWINSVISYSLGSTILHSFGSATSLGSDSFTGPPKFFTTYNIYGVPGASGSSIIGTDKHHHQVIGVTAVGSRVAADTRTFIDAFDADNNDVVDAIEYDLLLTRLPRHFYRLDFATPLQQAQWRRIPGEISSITSGPGFRVGHIGGRPVGPFAYRSAADSPFSGLSATLEDFEDGIFNAPGVTASAGAPLGPSQNTDSVDGDDGATADLSGTAGHSFFSTNGQAGITFSFDATVIGALPTHAGIVWTDGGGETTFEAFGANGVSLGTIGPIAIADDSHSGTIRDDRFFGVIHQGGISAIKLRNSSGGIEVDHLQYSVVAPPAGESDGLWHTTAQFAPGATYRISMVVYGLAEDAASPYVAFRSDSGASRLFHFRPALNGWSRIVGRVTLGNYPDYRLILGENGTGSYYVDSIAIVREDGGAKLNFETGEERRYWEYAPGSHATSWGMAGPDDFSGVVVGPSPTNPSSQWNLRNRNIGLQANKTYEIAFDVAHVSGPLNSDLFFKVQDLSGVTEAQLTWRFTQAGERATKVMRVTTQHERNAITFGASSPTTYMVDNIRIEER